MEAYMGTMLSSVPLLTHQSCRVSTTQIPLFRQQCNLSPRYTISAFHSFPTFLFHVEHLPQFEQVVPLDKNSNDRNNPLLQTLCYNDHTNRLHSSSQPFSEFLLFKSSQFRTAVLIVEKTL